MSAKQLRLLPASKPLTERLGADFFRELPEKPGVYFMFDGQRKLLYVGQSQNLKDRLNSYRHVSPDRDSRKTIRLVHCVERIEFEICASPEKAIQRENELLRTLRPKFNRMNTYPKACFFIGLRFEDEGVVLALTHDTDFEGSLFGAFKHLLQFSGLSV